MNGTRTLTTLTSVDEVLGSVVFGLAELSDEDLGLLVKMLERVYMHCMIEGELRHADTAS